MIRAYGFTDSFLDLHATHQDALTYLRAWVDRSAPEHDARIREMVILTAPEYDEIREAMRALESHTRETLTKEEIAFDGDDVHEALNVAKKLRTEK